MRERSESTDVSELGDCRGVVYEQAKKAIRNAHTLKIWFDGFVTQVAAAWMPSCVFVRYLEGNSFVEPPSITGRAVADASGSQGRLKWSRDEHDHWTQNNLGQTDRDYLCDALTTPAALPAAAKVFGPHNPLNALRIWLSSDAAQAMLTFFQKVGADSKSPAIVHDFNRACGDARFLEVPHQDFSEAVPKKYLLLIRMKLNHQPRPTMCCAHSIGARHALR